jgi:hypothetical protein
MTGDNVALMRDAEESGLFEAVWFSNARVGGKDKKGRIHVLDIFDNFHQIVNSG